MAEHNILSVSGGKDSTALLALAVVSDVPNLQAVFADTGHEHPLTYDYLGYLSDWLISQGHSPIRWVKADFSEEIEAKRARLLAIAEGREQDRHGKNRHTPESARLALEFLQATGNPFLDLCLLKSRFPSAKARFCTQELKRNPLFEQVMLPLMDGNTLILSWQGVRAEESLSRRFLPECDAVGAGLFNYRPLLRWTVADVFEAIEFVGLEPNPLYRQGMKRVGCMPCIHCGKDELLEIGRRFPDQIDRVEAMEAAVSRVSKIGMATFFPTADGRGEGVRAVVEWSKTSRGRLNYDLLRTSDEVRPCQSAYGLCE